MDNYCTKCGNKLEPGQKVCARCGNRVNGTVLNDFADKIKAYDYKGKAEELKVKANETMDKVKSYDYKEKTDKIAETVKNYADKAKDVSDTIMTYDYKTESENIKKGGIKYFWNRHKKLSVCVVCFIAVIGIFTCVNHKKITVSDNEPKQEYNSNAVDDNNSIVQNNRFTCTRTEFIKKYDELHNKLDDNPYLTDTLADCKYYTSEPNASTLEMQPNAYKEYIYDTTLYSSDDTRVKSSVNIAVDKNDNVVLVSIFRFGHAIQTKEAKQHYMYADCTAAYMAVTGTTSIDAAKDELYDVYCSSKIRKRDKYEYGYNERDDKNGSYDTGFYIKIINQ